MGCAQHQAHLAADASQHAPLGHRRDAGAEQLPRLGRAQAGAGGQDILLPLLTTRVRRRTRRADADADADADAGSRAARFTSAVSWEGGGRARAQRQRNASATTAQRQRDAAAATARRRPASPAVSRPAGERRIPCGSRNGRPTIFR
eukprot:scaffold6182_cov309-Prasinococcus_capsulatus_cf.AAC.1